MEAQGQPIIGTMLSDEGHRAALKVIEELFDAENGSLAALALGALADYLDAYEDSRWPIDDDGVTAPIASTSD